MHFICLLLLLIPADGLDHHILALHFEEMAVRGGHARGQGGAVRIRGLHATHIAQHRAACSRPSVVKAGVGSSVVGSSVCAGLLHTIVR